MQIHQVADVCKDEAVGCARKEDERAGEEGMKQRNKSLQKCFHVPTFVCFSFS